MGTQVTLVVLALLAALAASTTPLPCREDSWAPYAANAVLSMAEVSFIQSLATASTLEQAGAATRLLMAALRSVPADGYVGVLMLAFDAPLNTSYDVDFCVPPAAYSVASFCQAAVATGNGYAVKIRNDFIFPDPATLTRRRIYTVDGFGNFVGDPTLDTSFSASGRTEWYPTPDGEWSLPYTSAAVPGALLESFVRRFPGGVVAAARFSGEPCYATGQSCLNNSVGFPLTQQLALTASMGQAFSTDFSTMVQATKVLSDSERLTRILMLGWVAKLGMSFRCIYSCRNSLVAPVDATCMSTTSPWVGIVVDQGAFGDTYARYYAVDDTGMMPSSAPLYVNMSAAFDVTTRPYTLVPFGWSTMFGADLLRTLSPVQCQTLSVQTPSATWMYARAMTEVCTAPVLAPIQPSAAAVPAPVHSALVALLLVVAAVLCL